MEKRSGCDLRELAARLLQKVAMKRLALLDAQRMYTARTLT
jgi:hypothetical protein